MLHCFIFYVSSFVLIVNIFVWRVYINYYDIKYSQQMINNDWKSIINSSITNNTNNKLNWFITHKNTLGNPRYWTKFVALTYILCVITLYIWVFAQCNVKQCLAIRPWRESEEDQIVQIWLGVNNLGILFCIPGGILLAIFRCKTPKFADNFFVRKEIRYILICFMLTITCNMPTIGIIVISGDEFISDMMGFISFMIYDTCLLFIVLVHTVWSIHKNRRWLHLFNKHNYTHIKTPSARIAVQLNPLDSFNPDNGQLVLSTYNLAKLKDDVSDGMDRSKTGTPTPSASGGIMTELKILIGKDEGFNSFMFHLSTEFSVEIMLSLIEFNEYRHYAMIKGSECIGVNMDDDDEKEERHNSYNVRKDIFKMMREKNIVPDSEVVYDNNFGNDGFKEDNKDMIDLFAAMLSIKDDERRIEQFKLLYELMTMSYYLFCKYINVGSLAEINISYIERQRLIDVFGPNANDFDLAKKNDFIKNRIKNRLILNKNSTILMEINLFYHIFDDSCDEMTKLLAYSFTRFRDGTLFQMLSVSNK